MTKSPSMLIPAAIGGTVGGVTSALPLIGALNCACCSLIIGGGMMAAFMYSRNCKEAGVGFRAGNGALLGLFAGLFFALSYTIVAGAQGLISAGSGGGFEAELAKARERIGDMDLPPEQQEKFEEGLATFEEFIERFGPFVLLIVVFGFSLIIGCVFSTIGGLIGGAVFKVEPGVGV